MKLNSLTAVLLLSPALSNAFELPFKLPAQVEELRAKVGSQFDAYSDSIKSRLDSASANFHLPKFIKNIADPVAASPVLSLHRSLVDTPSVTGSEHAVSALLAEYLTSKNFTVETQAVAGGEGDRQNIFAYLGTNRTTSTLVTSHLDTVPPFIPYKATSNSIYGRGSNDAKGSVAAQVIAVEELIAEGILHEGDVSLLYVVGEEATGDGMKAANNLGLSWQTVIFGEPTGAEGGNKLAVGHKGVILFDVVARGKASHSGYPELGVSANSHLIKALSILDNLELPKSDLLGETTLNIGRIDGGVAANVIPAYAKAEVAVRVAGDLNDTLTAIKEAVEEIPVELEFKDVAYGPVELDHDIEGFETVVCSYGTDIPHLKGDHKKYLYGPGSILTAHGENEFVLKSDLVEAVAGFKKLIKESLWPTKRVPDIVLEKPETTVTETTTVSSSAVVVDKESETPVAEETPEVVVAGEEPVNESEQKEL